MLQNKYIVVTICAVNLGSLEKTAMEFRKKVEGMMTNAWMPLRGVSMVEDEGGNRAFSQAMLKDN